jgi:heavy metal sensor kinase
MLPITTRLTLWFLGTFGGIIIIVAVVMYATYASSERVLLDEELQSYAEFVVRNVSPGRLTLTELYDQLDTLTTEVSISFQPIRFILASRDSVVFDNTPEELIDQLLDSAQSASRARFPKGFETIVVDDATYRIYTRRIPYATSEDLTLIVVSSLDRVFGRLDRLRDLLLLIVPVALIAASAGGWFMARRALSPVSEITSTAAAISSSSLDRRVPVSRSKDELAYLAIVFNRMISRLERTFKSQQQFIADASHDLRTPLTIVRVELELLLQRSDLDSDERRSIDQCVREIDRLSNLASDLLLLARADSRQLGLTKERLRLDEFLVDCISRMMPLARQKQISLRVDIDDPIEASFDQATLRRAITNILDNAIKYSSESSTVEVSLRQEDHAARVTIADNGFGVSEEELPKLFDRFYRSDRARSTQGSGLGLAIARAIVEAHRGKLMLRSQPGAGTTVEIVLPL